MHQQQVDFIKSVLKKYPEYKSNVKVLDVGSQDINGNNRQFFDAETTEYTGLDIAEGNNVDVVSKVHEYKTRKKYDVVISGEMLEHDKHYKESIKAMTRLTKRLGILIITCASEGREEHGTHGKHEWTSPHTLDHYHNISIEEFKDIIDLDKFLVYDLQYNQYTCDLYFYGIKK
jgi:cyclopropane fatty-acyl-phospholipid synthase-like methyltransferase